MRKNIFIVVMLLGMVSVLSGCVALLAGVGGTALWQGGKVISEELVSLERATTATEAAFKAKKITQTDKVTKSEVVQLRADDANNTRVAVDIFEKGAKNVRIEIRYGLGEETPARDLLSEIKKRL